MATEKVKVVKLDTAPAQNSIKDLKQQLKDLKNVMLSTEQGTDEYNAALQQAAQIQHTMKEQMQEINATAMDFGQIVSNCTQAVGGLVGGFQAATAVMNLFGTENEDVIKTLKTMQQLMSITQALPAIDNGVKAFKRLAIAIKASTTALKGLNTATIATGLGAITAALGLLITNWDKVTEAMRKWGIISEDTKAKIAEQKKALEDWRTALDKARGELYNQETADKVSKMNEKAKKSYDELTKSITNLELQQKVVEADRQVEWRTNGERTEKAYELTQQFNDLTVQIQNLHKAQRALLDDANSYKEIPKNVGTAIKETKTNINELEILLWNAAQELAPQSLQQELLAKFGGSGIPLPVKIVPEEDEEEDTSFEDAFRQRIEGTINSLRQAFGTSEEEQYQQELHALDVALNTKLIKEEEYYKLRDALNKEYTQREIQRYSLAANSIGSIFSSLGELMEEGSEEQKAMQIMGATINMLGGIVSAISGVFTTHTGPWDIALAVLQAGAIATSGAATIAKMAKTNESNAASMASASPATSAISSIIAPVQYTQDVQGASIEGAIKDTKVYVTETDITNTQNKVRVSENEARF